MKISFRIQRPQIPHFIEDKFQFFGGRFIIMWATIDSAQVNIKRLLKRNF